jgi:hypothetical protein
MSCCLPPGLRRGADLVAAAACVCMSAIESISKVPAGDLPRQYWCSQAPSLDSRFIYDAEHDSWYIDIVGRVFVQSRLSAQCRRAVLATSSSGYHCIEIPIQLLEILMHFVSPLRYLRFLRTG